MSREEIRKLIGGYATGTLTQAERRILFEAALEDQELFDELAAEDALREMLDQPGAKPRLIAALAPTRKPVWARGWPWAAGIATAALAVLVVVALRQPTAPQQIAQVQAPVEHPSPGPTILSERQNPAEREKTPAPSKAPEIPAAKNRARQAEPAPAAGERREAFSQVITNQPAPEPAPKPAAPPPLQAAAPQPQQASPAAPLPPAGVNAAQPKVEQPELEKDQKQAAKADAVQEAIETRSQAAQAGQAPAAPAPQAQASARAAGGRGGRGGGGAGGGGKGVAGGRATFGGFNANGLLTRPAPAFGFDYSLGTDRRLSVRPRSDGFLTVILDRTTTLFANRPVRADSDNPVDLPAEATSAAVVFSAQATAATPMIDPAQTDAPVGFKSDPNPAPPSPLIAVIPLPRTQ